MSAAPRQVACPLCGELVSVDYPTNVAICGECVSDYGHERILAMLQRIREESVRQLRHDIRAHLQTIVLQAELMMRINDPVQRATSKGAVDRAVQAITEALAGSSPVG